MSRSDDPTPTTARSRDARIEAVRARLRERTGPAYWRSLEELAEDEAFLELLHDEFPQQAGPLGNAVDRRRFLQLGAASLALGGMAACTRQPLEKIVPYVEQPEQVVPGRPLFFASAMSIDGLAVPLIVESHEGRPTKVEGNPDHPLGTGASDVIAQASVLGLYDPDRSQVVKRNGRISGLAALESNLRGRVEALDALEGLRLRILTPTLSSPTLERLVDEILHSHPLARWHTWDPVTRDETDLGSRIAYGEAVATRYDLAHCDVVLALESNFLVEGPRHLRDARDFAERRRLEGSELNRLYAVESTPTATGTVADHRLALRPSQIAPFAQAVAAALNLGPAPDGLDTAAADLAAAVAADLALHPRRSAV
ncbi:MAG: TAT-variant-translocated molybdopterin oxidoreductase, partial [Thermoanaerobaculia bacterium]|nr:TAT-variant-translocated molybdopterin oxidoreductase [Thermoanaerobaculia bacterium]